MTDLERLRGDLEKLTVAARTPMSERSCIASWEAVEELGDNCPLCGRACYAHELEEDRDARTAGKGS